MVALAEVVFLAQIKLHTGDIGAFSWGLLYRACSSTVYVGIFARRKFFCPGEDMTTKFSTIHAWAWQNFYPAKFFQEYSIFCIHNNYYVMCMTFQFVLSKFFFHDTL